jgi:hypothetical protein
VLKLSGGVCIVTLFEEMMHFPARTPHNDKNTKMVVLHTSPGKRDSQGEGREIKEAEDSQGAEKLIAAWKAPI